MNNSDIIAALSLALTVIIFLFQSNSDLFKLKIRPFEKIILVAIVMLIIFLGNYKVFERLSATIYFSIGNFYLRPDEWAFVLFLILIVISLIRIFSFKIYNNDPQIINDLIRKYNTQRKYEKLKDLLVQIMNLKTFESQYGDTLDKTLFSDVNFLEFFSANYPEVIITFSAKYPNAFVNTGEMLYYIFKGLFSNRSNQIFSEISQYKNDSTKSLFLDDYSSLWLNRELLNRKPHPTSLAIISFVCKIMKTHPFHLKEDTKYFLNHFKEELKDDLHNKLILSENEITKSFSRDTVFNILQFFRIVLIELSYFDKQFPLLIGRPLLLLFSSWDFLEDCNQTITEKVRLDNDSYTFNEYLLKYLFETYCSLFILNKLNFYDNLKRKNRNNEEHISFILGQIFRKIDSIIKNDKVKDYSKKYYIKRLLTFFYDLSEYFSGDVLKDIDKSIAYEFKYSLDNSPWGNSELFRQLFTEVCKSYEFYRLNNERNNIERSQFLYEYLLPFTDGLNYNFMDK